MTAVPVTKTAYTPAEQRQLVLWELHKEVHGFRPRHYTEAEWADESFVEARIKALEENL